MTTFLIALCGWVLLPTACMTDLNAFLSIADRGSLLHAYLVRYFTQA